MKSLLREEFDQKLNSGEKFIVDFYAEWCGPCKMMAPIIERVSSTLKSQGSDVNIYKFDIEQDRDLAMELGIRGVPTIKAFVNGGEVFSKAGLMMEKELNDLAQKI